MIFDLNFLQFFLLAIVIFFSALIQASLGLGFTLFAAPFVVFINPNLAPVPLLILGFLTSTVMAVKSISRVVWIDIKISVFGRLLGVISAFFVLRTITSDKVFLILYACSILFLVVLSILKFNPTFNKTNLFFASIVSGLTGTVTSVGGPPMALIYQEQKPETSKPTLSLLFSLGSGLSLVALYFAGRVELKYVYSSLLLLPICIIGLYCNKYLKVFSLQQYRFGLLAVAGFGALILLFNVIFYNEFAN